MYVFPAPIDTPTTATDKRFFSDPWNRYFKALGDQLMQMFSVKNSQQSKNFKYVVNGCLLVAVYYSTTPLAADLTVTLPLPSLLAFDINGTVYAPNTSQVSIPAGTTYLTFTAVVNTTQSNY